MTDKLQSESRELWEIVGNDSQKDMPGRNKHEFCKMTDMAYALNLQKSHVGQYEISPAIWTKFNVNTGTVLNDQAFPSIACES